MYLDNVADDLEYLTKLLKEYPLIGWVAWDCPSDRMSQRRAMSALGVVCTFFFGGNRSGKTEALRALVVVFALGRDHPMVAVWAQVNGFDLEAMGVPTGPGRVFCVAKSSPDSIRYHRKQIDRMLPRGGKRWNNAEGKGEAVCRITVPGYETEAEIFFKSADQGREAMQGDSVRLAAIDEEPPEPVWNELLLRVADQKGTLICSMTPLKGLTWVYQRYSGVPKPAEEGSRAHWLDALDNPHLDKETFERLYRSMTEAERAARQKGSFTVLENRVYPLWSRAIHTCEHFDIPANWSRFRAADFGSRHNTCVLWGALGEDGCLYLYREVYGRLTTSTLAKRVREAEGYVWQEGRKLTPDDKFDAWQIEGDEVRPHWRRTRHTETMEGSVGDPSARAIRIDLRMDHDINFGKAKRDWDVGRAAVMERLALEDDNRPRLYVVRTKGGSLSCPNLVKEIEAYVDNREDHQRDGPPPRPPSGDDAMDALRYLCARVRFL